MSFYMSEHGGGIPPGWAQSRKRMTQGFKNKKRVRVEKYDQTSVVGDGYCYLAEL